MGMKHWKVRAVRDGRTVDVGQVDEPCESLARCAALSRFGVSEDEICAGEVRARAMVIYPDEDFEASPAM